MCRYIWPNKPFLSSFWYPNHNHIKAWSPRNIPNICNVSSLRGTWIPRLNQSVHVLLSNPCTSSIEKKKIKYSQYCWLELLTRPCMLICWPALQFSPAKSPFQSFSNNHPWQIGTVFTLDPYVHTQQWYKSSRLLNNLPLAVKHDIWTVYSMW